MTGATGAIGPAVVTALSGVHEIRTLSRRRPAEGLFTAPVRVYLGDVADVQAVRQAVAGADVVVHLAALLHLTDPPPAMRAEYERTNIHGTAAILEAAASEGLRRVVVLSTIAVYGHSDGAVLDEQSPVHPSTFYASTKLEAERLALTARRADGTPLATVLRSAAVYGPRVKGNYRRLVRALARRRFVPVGPGRNRRTLVFEEDLAAAIAAAAVHPDAAGRLYNVTDGALHPLHEIIGAICAALGRRAPAWHLPLGPVRAALSVGGVFHRGLPRMLDKYLEDIAVKGERIGTEIGFRPRVGLDDGWRRTVQEMRS